MVSLADPWWLGEKGGIVMYFTQADLLRGMNKPFIEKFMGIAIKESYKKGYFLFRDGDPANHFYILLKGKVKITIGESGHTVYAVDHAGEAFGWSSLVDRDVYSASAECKDITKLLKIDKKDLQKIIEEDPVNGFVFYKKLAGTLGIRLIQFYKVISSESQTEITPSFGTGQVIESEATAA